MLPDVNASSSATVSASVSTRACLLPSVSETVNQQVIQCLRIARSVARYHRLNLFYLVAQVSTSAYSPHRVLSSDFSFISSTVSLSVSTSVSPVVSASTSDSVSASASTSGFAPPHVSPTDTQQVIECIPIS